MRIDVRQSRELRAVLAAMRTIDTTLAKIIRRETKRIATPEWTKALQRRANTALEQRVMVNTATVSASNQNVRVTSANKGRPLSGGMRPKESWHAVEFGADREREATYYRQSKRGGAHKVTRRVARGLKPRTREGYVFYPAAREMVPRLASLWVQTVVRTIHNAFEGKQE